MRLLRLIFGKSGPHREEEKRATADLENASARNREATKRNIKAGERLQRAFQEKGMVEALTDAVLKEVKHK